jgi:transposase InsO family protein
VLCAAAHNTYIPTWQGWVYLATVIDCATRKIVGWAMDDNYRTPLIKKAIRMAARNISLPEEAIFHSDRGSNYMSGEFAKELKKLGIRQSVGRTGICPLTGQSLETCRSATRREVPGCLPGGDGGDTPVRHEHGGLPAAA